MIELRLPTRGDVVKLTVGLSLAAGGVAALRQLTTRRICMAERLADSLLDTARLRDAWAALPERTGDALAGCADFCIEMAFRSSDHLGSADVVEDPVGQCRTQTHPYTRAAAAVLTEAGAPDCVLTYAVVVPGSAEVRGTRRLGMRKIAGLAPARPMLDAMQVTLGDNYTAQMETEFDIADLLVTSHGRLFGTVTMRDNCGNAARINIRFDGTIAGAMTRDARVVGRFEGKVPGGIRFKQYQLESGRE